ncbi:pre-mRNA 3' end processing protein WDR33 [Eupeodes corollae]|uniref:pre-mRNA 3' end processing protein WDR33 n=1 Tax=Eupeodes corollae TaxID=290404 RepID=UPI00249397A6|nr:pre-mRNA 3' end processing protein WDR33 [Eupeodes corollae]
MDFSQPPPDMLQQPPPSMMQMPPPPVVMNYNNSGQNNGPGGGGGGGGAGGGGGGYRTHYFQHHSGPGKPGHPYFKPFGNFNRGFGMTQDDFDGKRLRKSVMRKTVDYNASIVKALEARTWQRDDRDRPSLQPENIYIPELLPPPSYLDNPTNSVTTRFVKTATNKMRCPIFTLAWTPEGRRLVTGASSGEFTLWNGLTFNFETILQAHDVPVRTMVWSHNDNWMVTGDNAGYVKYWQSNMNNVKMFQAHKEAIRGISFSPTDSKFVSCSDDGTLRVWDFYRCQEERVLRGHGADVKCVHWHPQKALIVSGSKDNQQPIKLWDPKSGQALATLHAHKSTVMDLKWNNNGNWLVTASRDHLLKLFDIRNLREEVQVFRGHKKEASSVSWHPVHEGLFSSGGSDGSVLFWNVGTDKEIGGIDTAHDSIVWTLAWHPLGHILCSGSNDHTIKFWTRNRPGDLMRDKYNLNTLPASLSTLDECEYDDAVIPGMGPEDKVEFTESLTADKGFIPGLDLDPNKIIDRDREKKVPYSKPIPRNFQAHWNDSRRNEEGDENNLRDSKEISMLAEDMPDNMDPSTIVGISVYGRVIRVMPDTKLAAIIRNGPDALNRYISSGEIDELSDVVPVENRRSKSPNRDRSRSPPVKKSRFEPINHNAKVIYAGDIDWRRNINNPFSGVKVKTNDEPEVLPNGDVDFRRIKSEDMGGGGGRPSPWATGPLANNDSNRASPWATPQQNGFNNNNNSSNAQFNTNAFNTNTNTNQNNPFGAPSHNTNFRDDRDLDNNSDGGRNDNSANYRFKDDFDDNNSNTGNSKGSGGNRRNRERGRDRRHNKNRSNRRF